MSKVIVHADAMNELFRSTSGPAARDLARRAIQVDLAAKRFAPVDTGRLRSSLTWRIGFDALGLFAQIGSDVSYAAYQELGTRYMAAHPYLRPALAAGAK